MIDFKQYDNGAVSHLGKLKLNRLPLLSWDFYGDFYQSLSGNIADLNQLHLMAVENNWCLDTEITEHLQQQMVVVVTDTAIRIVFSSKNIIHMTGYKQEEVIGKSPKMFQGHSTSGEISAAIRNAIDNRKPFDKTVVNYKKDGTAYDCHIKGFPIFNSKGSLCHFIAFERAA